MPANVSFEFSRTEKELAVARTIEEKIALLKKLISLMPSHKGAERLRASLRARLAKLKKEVAKKGKKAKRVALIKKTGDTLVCLIGLTNCGKSLLLKALTAAKPAVSQLPFTTTKPEQGILNYGGCLIQIVELPALHSKNDSESLGIARSADLIVLVATSNNEVNDLLTELKKARISIPVLIIHNKADVSARIPFQSKLSVSALTGKNIDKLKDMIFERLRLIRVYTKEPGKRAEKKPVVLREGLTIKEFAAKIHKDFVKKFSHALVWGSSAKFPGQRIGFNHILKDQDIVEIHLKK